MKKILIGCEESQCVCQAFRDIGYEAYSCDIIVTSGNKPEWHIQDNIINVIKNEFWDMLIAFPPCTHLCISGAKYFSTKSKDGRQEEAIKFFLDLINMDIEHIAIENPVGIMSSIYRKPDQIIQPWWFGHNESKPTCLWLKNLPKLIPTNIVLSRGSKIHYMSPGENRGKLRSKTYSGIAKAMANQWSNIL